MQATTPTYRAAVERAERYPRARVLVDWRRNPGGPRGVVNGDFEIAATLGWGFVPGFDLPDVAATEERAHSGRWSMRVDWPDPTPPPIPTGVGVAVPVVPGRTYLVRAWVWVPAGSMPVEFGDMDGARATSTLTERWELLEQEVTAVGDTMAVGVAAAAPTTAGQHVYVDDVDLVDVLAPTRVEGVTIDRSITSDLPGDVTLITGHSVAQVDIDLAGDPNHNGRGAATIYSAYNADVSPIAQIDPEDVPVSVQLGFRTPQGDELLPAISARARDLSAVASDQSAPLQAFDTSIRLQIPARLPLTVGRDATAATQGLPPGAGLNSQWVTGALAAQGGFNASPPPRPDCVLSATLHGSLQADVGELLGLGGFLRFTSPSTTNHAAPTYTQGRFALAPTPGSHEVFQASYTTAPVTLFRDTRVTMSGWVWIPSTPDPAPTVARDTSWAITTPDEAWQVLVTIDTTAPGETTLTTSMNLENPSSPVTILSEPLEVPPGWHYVGVHFTAEDTGLVSAVLQLDHDNLGGVAVTVPPGLSALAQPMTLGVLQSSMPVEA